MFAGFLGKGRTALDTLFLDAEQLVDRSLKTLSAVPEQVALAGLGSQFVLDGLDLLQGLPLLIQQGRFDILILNLSIIGPGSPADILRDEIQQPVEQYREDQAQQPNQQALRQH